MNILLIIGMVNNTALDLALNNANLIRDNSSYFSNLTQDYDMDNSNIPIDSCSSTASSQNKSMRVIKRFFFDYYFIL